MCISEIEKLAQSVADRIIEIFIGTDGTPVEYDSSGCLLGNIDTYSSFKGIYAFRLTKANETALAYIGKSEKNGRIRQHIQNTNADGSSLASSTRNKHGEIRKAISAGFSVSFCLYSDSAFSKASLACIEIVAAQKAKQKFTETFPGVPHWNSRLG